MRTRPIGSIIGAIGGLLFVLLNATSVPLTPIWWAFGVAGFVGVIWFAVLRGPMTVQQPPTRAALRTYGFAVLAMMIAIVAGARVLNALDRSNAVVPWVVLVVGAHFLPFAGAFGVAVFRLLALSLILVAVVGGVATFIHDSATTAGWTGVVAGFVLLLFATVGPRLTNRDAAIGNALNAGGRAPRPTS